MFLFNLTIIYNVIIFILLVRKLSKKCKVPSLVFLTLFCPNNNNKTKSKQEDRRLVILDEHQPYLSTLLFVTQSLTSLIPATQTMFSIISLCLCSCFFLFFYTLCSVTVEQRLHMRHTDMFSLVHNV